MLTMLLTASVIALVFGFISLFDTEFAWSLHEADARIMGTKLQRTRNWQTWMMLQGALLVALGAVGILVSMGALHF
jgi:hypothetical protein